MSSAIRTRHQDMYEILKNVHIITAALTICGFVLRGIWMLRDSALLTAGPTRILPHIVDTLFLLSGIGLIWVLNLPVLKQSWLLVKFVALIAYVVLGTIALRKGRTRRIRVAAFARCNRDVCLYRRRRAHEVDHQLAGRYLNQGHLGNFFPQVLSNSQNPANALVSIIETNSKNQNS